MIHKTIEEDIHDEFQKLKTELKVFCSELKDLVKKLK